MISHTYHVPFSAVLMQDCDSSDPSQQWVVNDNGTIVNVAYDRCLDIWNCNAASNATVDSYPCAAPDSKVSRYSTTCGECVHVWLRLQVAYC